MNVTIELPHYDAQGRAFVTWRPVQAQLRLAGAALGPVSVTISSKTTGGGGGLIFATTLTSQGQSTLALTLPAAGTPLPFFVGGEFPAASITYGDVKIEVRNNVSGRLLGSHPLMVRIRRNANLLSSLERDRFLAALAALNGAGIGRYSDFRDMHVGGPPDLEAHGGPGFLPWHRAYLLDFERELQAIDAEVALPYWRFDQAAPKVFTQNFMGVPNAFNQVQFAAGHALQSWVAHGSPGISRGPGVGPRTVPALLDEAQTLALGGPSPGFVNFQTMQGNPHGAAHNSHGAGWIMNPSTAPRDPLFFLLHCNVDRLWAKWQWSRRIHTASDPRAFTPARGHPPGHRLADKLWPWCGPLTAPRPVTAPGGALTASPMTIAPGATPTIRDMIDYFGTVAGTDLAFGYDDVPFQL